MKTNSAATRLLFSAMIALSCASVLHAAPISRETLKEIYAIGDELGVPRSVVRQLMIEESGDRKRGILGDPWKESPYTDEGYRSIGLFQIYTRPDNLHDLLHKHWYRYDPDEIFNIFHPIHNATVALRYLAALHRQYGTWYQALLFYNHGNVTGASPETHAYALRIISAPEVPL